MLFSGYADAQEISKQTTDPSGVSDPIFTPDIDEQNKRSEIIVTARRGSASITPEEELNPEEIDAYGADSISELIGQIQQEYGMDEGVETLVNGQRVPSSGIYTAFPPDAMERLEILPAEAGAIYGTEPSHRVVNVVLVKNFSSLEGTLRSTAPTAGGTSTIGGQMKYGNLGGMNVNSLTIDADRQSILLADERPQYLQSNPGYEGTSLRPSTYSMNNRLALARTLGDWLASFNVGAQGSKSHSIYQGSDGLIDNHHRSWSLNSTAGLGGNVGQWDVQANLSANIEKSSRSSFTQSNTNRQSVRVKLSSQGTVLDLPAGPAKLNFNADTSYQHSLTRTEGSEQGFNTRSSSAKASLSIPLLKRDKDGEAGGLLRHLGDLRISLGTDYNQSGSGKGSGTRLSLTWRPMSKLSLSANWRSDISNVKDTERFTAEYYGDPITVYDFTTGKTVQAQQILGGNPDLRSPRSKNISLSASVGTFTDWKLRYVLSYQTNINSDAIGAIREITPEFEAAFPDRFLRNNEGTLITIDQRPLNFDSSRSERLRSVISATPARGGRGRVGLRFSLNHNWTLRDTSQINSALPLMDRLAGDGGGGPRHRTTFSANFSQGDWRAKASASWASGYRTRETSGVDNTDDLLIAPNSTVNLHLSRRFMTMRPPQTEGGRARRAVGLELELAINNLFDTHHRSRLASGAPALGLGYGRYDRNPLGRTIEFSIKKRF